MGELVEPERAPGVQGRCAHTVCLGDLRRRHAAGDHACGIDHLVHRVATHGSSPGTAARWRQSSDWSVPTAGSTPAMRRSSPSRSRSCARRSRACEIVVFSRDCEHTERHHDVDRVVAHATPCVRSSTPRSSGWTSCCSAAAASCMTTKPSRTCALVRFAQDAGVATATYAVGAGPLERPADREAVAAVLNEMQLDHRSREGGEAPARGERRGARDLRDGGSGAAARARAVHASGCSSARGCLTAGG